MGYNKKERTGRLRERIRLLQYLTERDDYGGQPKRWVASDPIWAAVEQKAVGSMEKEIAQRVVSLNRTVVTIKHKDTVSPTMKILWRGQIISINNVIPDFKREYMELIATQDEPKELESWADENELGWVDEHGGFWQWSNNRDQNNEVAEGESWTDDSGLTWKKQ